MTTRPEAPLDNVGRCVATYQFARPAHSTDHPSELVREPAGFLATMWTRRCVLDVHNGDHLFETPAGAPCPMTAEAVDLAAKP